MFYKKIFLNDLLFKTTVAFEGLEDFSFLDSDSRYLRSNCTLYRRVIGVTLERRVWHYMFITDYPASIYGKTMGQGADKEIMYLNKLCDCNSNAQ